MFKVAEIELIYRSKVKAKERIQVSSSSAAYKVFNEYWDHDKIEFQEEFKILLLNRQNQALGIYDISKGGVAGTVVDVKMIFSAALKAHASYIILCHNHPSGNLNPSRQDIQLTKKVYEAGRLLDIGILDHLILTSEGYTSLADKGYI
ncbi:RadC-like JAB domain-containing protein [Reichenbachiella faecimaris]|uniref:RadC-like JAB domain-containing protein n=1 Tax=Reichenbachiella faecimaris TaxID=692418 RepID=A0A1W2GHN2_REIFA|nr:JAB domain-containing protein [Reichenbachiella faecimaris]SMD36081.1 RadC-like JAB domain-containing protein [Reichenbachiella faecimaris]